MLRITWQTGKGPKLQQQQVRVCLERPPLSRRQLALEGEVSSEMLRKRRINLSEVLISLVTVIRRKDYVIQEGLLLRSNPT